MSEREDRLREVERRLRLEKRNADLRVRCEQAEVALARLREAESTVRLALLKCTSAASAIVEDWTDPRHDCRVIQAAVRDGLAALDGARALAEEGSKTE